MFGVPQQLPRYRNLEADLPPSWRRIPPRRWLILPLLFIPLLGLTYYYTSLVQSPPSMGAQRRVPKLPSPSFAATQQRWPELQHLIVVPGHGIQWCSEGGKSPYQEDCWFLAGYQRGQVVHFLAHLQRAIELAQQDGQALLVLSGGQTRPGVGARNEGRSYFQAAEQLGWLEGELYDRTVLEEHARDSLENLLFSLCRFHQVTGHYPQRVTVVGFPFKARRFITLHRQAVSHLIRETDFTYVGVELSDHPLDHIIDDAYPLFEHDLFGCQPALANKRMQRNPYRNQHGYAESCPELVPQLTACKPK